MNVEKLCLSPEESLKNSLKKLDETAEKVLFITDSSMRLLGTLSDGDVRRFLLKGASLESTIENAFNRKPFFVYEDEYDSEQLKIVMLKNNYAAVPVVDSSMVVKTFVTPALLNGISKNEMIKGSFDVPVVIMAGGKGVRMEPFTSVLPKPLLPIGNKTILEVIIHAFQSYQVRDFYLSLNYKAEMIEAYFNGIERDYNLITKKESDFWGTAGGLALFKDIPSDCFLVSNCDVLIRANYCAILDFHRSSGADLTIISSIQHHQIPYGTISFGEGGVVKRIDEKPEFTFTINTGVYLLNKNCLDFIPQNVVYDMPTLISSLIAANKRVVTYPVNEGDYIDVGQWDEYKAVLKKMSNSTI